MVTGTRARRLLARVDVLFPADDPSPPVAIWLPDNRRSDAGPGRHRVPGANAVLVVYDPAAESPPGDEG